MSAADIEYWRDVEDLWPGDDWKAKVRQAIQRQSMLYLACFSTNYAKRDKSTMNEEIRFAIGEYRKLAPGVQWIVPVRFDECEIPEFELEPGKTLRETPNWVNAFGRQKTAEVSRLIVTIHRRLGTMVTLDDVAARIARASPTDLPGEVLGGGQTAAARSDGRDRIG